MGSSVEEWWKSVKEGLLAFWDGWRGPLSLTTAFILIVAVVAGGVSHFGGETVNSDITISVAIILVVLFALYGFGMLVTFFWLFRGIKTDDEKLTGIITYCYAFIVFSLSASVLPFVALPLIPDLDKIMMQSPIGIVAGCSIALEGDEKNVPKELRCGAKSDQWVVNIGGTMIQGAKEPKPQAARPAGPTTPPAPNTQSSAPATPPSATVGKTTVSLVQIQGGLVVPLYAVVLSLMGAAVSMTRRVPEFQRRLSPGDPKYITNDEAREGLVFQIMQVLSAPLIVLTAYYLVDPGSRSSTIVLSFASGFSSETVLLLIRAILEKLKPAPAAAAVKPPDVRVVPPRLDFGNVTVGQASKKAVAITNSGTAELVISGLTCSGEFSAVTQGPVLVKIAPGSSGNVEAEFKPTTQGPKQGLLTIADNAAGSPRTVDLAGTGT
jgi:hypothetical protein